MTMPPPKAGVYRSVLFAGLTALAMSCSPAPSFRLQSVDLPPGLGVREPEGESAPLPLGEETMARNQKLTAVLKGREAIEADGGDGRLAVSFGDGSTLTVRLGAPAPDPIPLGVVRVVRQSDCDLVFLYEDGPSLELRTAEPTSCVMLRDRAGVLEYAD